jgi:hypothetical protein
MENTTETSEQPISSDTSTPSQLSVSVSGGSQSDIISPNDLSPTISSAAPVAAAVSPGESMIESSEFRAHMPEPTYQTLNGRMSPGAYSNSYATLTPLQPLPPISSVSDKFGHAGSPNVSGSFTFMQNGGALGAMDMNYRYDKIGSIPCSMSPVNMGHSLGVNSLASSPMSMNNGYGQPNTPLGSYPSYNVQNGLHSPKSESKMMSGNLSYDAYSRGLAPPPPPVSRMHSPNSMMAASLNGLHHSSSPTHLPNQHMVEHKPPMGCMDGGGGQKGQELEEINTKELAQRISSELKRYSIPQAVFAQRVLCRSQGTLSDLLRNPKPWSKLKSGRETFRRMWKWLQEPEFQRMSALRLAGAYSTYSKLFYLLYPPMTWLKQTDKIKLLNLFISRGKYLPLELK